MKIALVTDQLGDSRGADDYPVDPARRVLSLARALAGQGQHVTVYSRQDSARSDPAGRAGSGHFPGLTIEQIPAGPQENLPADVLLRHVAALAGQLADRWSCDPPDVIHAHFWTSGLAALAGARDLDIPVVQTFHSLGGGAGHMSEPRGAAPPGVRTGGGGERRRSERRGKAVPVKGERKGGGEVGGGGGPEASGKAPPGRALAGTGASAATRTRLEAAIGRSAAAVIAVTSHERTDLARLGVPRATVTIVPTGVDITRFRPPGPAAGRGRRPRLLLVSPPGDPQGPAAVLRALADIPGAELVIVGEPDGDSRDGTLPRLARTLGVRDRLICIERVSEAGMPPLMRSADVLVHLTPSPRFAVVPVEAMACGTPVIANDGAPGDAVIHGNTGFLVPSAEPAMLARRIRQLLASPMLLEGYGIAAASRARSRYSWERVGQETLAVYEALLAPLEAAA